MLFDIRTECTSPYGLPTYGKLGNSGMDVKANITEPITLKPFERKLIPTGLKFELPEDVEIQVRPRSGLAINKGLVAILGTVDENYRGEVKVILINLSQEEQTVEPGERVAQLVFSHVDKAQLHQVDKVNTNTNRGSSGFGASGRF